MPSFPLWVLLFTSHMCRKTLLCGWYCGQSYVSLQSKSSQIMTRTINPYILFAKLNSTQTVLLSSIDCCFYLLCKFFFSNCSQQSSNAASIDMSVSYLMNIHSVRLMPKAGYMLNKIWSVQRVAIPVQHWIDYCQRDMLKISRSAAAATDSSGSVRIQCPNRRISQSTTLVWKEEYIRRFLQSINNHL